MIIKGPLNTHAAKLGEVLFIPYLGKTKSSRVQEFAPTAWVVAQDEKFPQPVYPSELSSRQAEGQTALHSGLFYLSTQEAYSQDIITVIELRLLRIP